MLRNCVINTRTLKKQFFNATNVTRRSFSGVATNKRGLFGFLTKCNTNQLIVPNHLKEGHKRHVVVVASLFNGSVFSLRSYAKKKTAEVEAKDVPAVSSVQAPVLTPSPTNGFAQVAQVQIPHPGKANKGGEDACFISKDKSVIGVFDGVGGYAQYGLDPRDYAVKLAEGGKKLVDNTSERDPKQILEAGYIEAKNTKGGSTACVAVLNGNKVHMGNVGDSGMLIIRPPKTLFRSVAQQDAPNWPLIVPNEKDRVDFNEVKVNEDDIVILATDGVFDNIYDDDIINIVETILRVHKGADDLAQRVAVAIANQASLGGHGKANKCPWSGGKLDDVTVVVGIVGKVPEKDTAKDSKSKNKKNK